MVLTKALRAVRDKLTNPYGHYVNWLTRRVARPTQEECQLLAESGEDGRIDIVVVAFNSVELIQKQIAMLRKYLTDEYYAIIIIDNSTDKQKREAIRKLCSAEQVLYAAAPRSLNRNIHPRLFNYGFSHAAALSWAYRHLLVHRQPAILALLDHDLFPYAPYSIAEHLGDQPFYGCDRFRETGWYLWPGFSFFRADVLRDSNPNFMPVSYKGMFFDTGGSLYTCLYKQYERDGLRFAKTDTFKVRNSKLKNANEIYHSDCVQRIDDAWVHIINGSNYAHVKDKDRMIAEAFRRFK